MELEIKTFFIVIKKHFLIIFLLGIVSMVGAGFLTNHRFVPLYSSTVQLIMSPASAAGQSATQRVDTFRDIILRSPVILSSVIEELDLTESIGALQSTISISHISTSQMFSIHVAHRNPLLAQEIANAVADNFLENLNSILPIEVIGVLAYAELSASPSQPSIIRNMVLGALGGSVVGLMIAFLLDSFDHTIKSQAEIQEIMDVPLIGTVSNIHGIEALPKRKRKRVERHG